MATPIQLFPAGVSPLPDGSARSASSVIPGAEFAETLGHLVRNVNETTRTANEAVTSMVDKTGDVHDAIIALQRAETALQLTVQVRNKLVQAYQDVMRMPI
jgi:flagellar hook-basal body complex protein FliE